MIRQLIVLVCLTEIASAGIGPSFWLDTSAWHAADIVVATEAKEIDGHFTVLESWRGKLAVGSEVVIPELAKFHSLESRAVHSRGKTSAATNVSGERMILFLSRTNLSPRMIQPGTNALTWFPSAPPWGLENGFDVSVLWVEQGQTYGFMQMMNPGPSQLVPLATEAKTKEVVEQRTRTQQTLAEISAVADARLRAARASELIDSDLGDVRAAAFATLAGSKNEALPHLRKFLGDSSKRRFHYEAVDALVAAGGETVASDLKKMAEEELRFWKSTGPTLENGWWNRREEWGNEAVLRQRYLKTAHVFEGIARLHILESKGVVAEFRDFWRSQPQLEDKSGLNQMSQRCDAILASLK